MPSPIGLNKSFSNVQFLLLDLFRQFTSSGATGKTKQIDLSVTSFFGETVREVFIEKNI